MKKIIILFLAFGYEVQASNISLSHRILNWCFSDSAQVSNGQDSFDVHRDNRSIEAQGIFEEVAPLPLALQSICCASAIKYIDEPYAENITLNIPVKRNNGTTFTCSQQRVIMIAGNLNPKDASLEAYYQGARDTHELLEKNCILMTREDHEAFIKEKEDRVFIECKKRENIALMKGCVIGLLGAAVIASVVLTKKK